MLFACTTPNTTGPRPAENRPEPAASDERVRCELHHGRALYSKAPEAEAIRQVENVIQSLEPDQRETLGAMCALYVCDEELLSMHCKRLTQALVWDPFVFDSNHTTLQGVMTLAERSQKLSTLVLDAWVRGSMNSARDGEIARDQVKSAIASRQLAPVESAFSRYKKDIMSMPEGPKKAKMVTLFQASYDIFRYSKGGWTSSTPSGDNQELNRLSNLVMATYKELEHETASRDGMSTVSPRCWDFVQMTTRETRQPPDAATDLQPREPRLSES